MTEVLPRGKTYAREIKACITDNCKESGKGDGHGRIRDNQAGIKQRYVSLPFR